MSKTKTKREDIKPDIEPRVMTGTYFMLGDHACAEGALAAGIDFFGGYLDDAIDKSIKLYRKKHAKL